MFSFLFRTISNNVVFIFSNALRDYFSIFLLFIFMLLCISFHLAYFF